MFLNYIFVNKKLCEYKEVNMFEKKNWMQKPTISALIAQEYTESEAAT